MITESLIKQIEDGRDGRCQGISMGLPKLEGIIDGVSRQTYTIIFGQSSSGKTSAAIYAYVYRPCMEHLEDDDFHVIYFSLEISAELLMAKLLSLYIFEHYHIDLSTKDILSRTKGSVLSEEHFAIVQECIPWLKKIERMITIFDGAQNAQTIYTTLVNELAKVGKFEQKGDRRTYIPKNKKRTTVVVIDHMNLLTHVAGRTIKQEIDLTSQELVQLRNMCGISPVAIMQANRDSMSMSRRDLLGSGDCRISDIRDSAGPSQDAEIVIGIYNPFRDKIATYRGYDIKQLQDSFRSFTILKNRYGESEVADCMCFYGKVGVFVEPPTPDKIYDYSKYQTPFWIFEDKEKEEDENKNDQTLNFTL